MRDPISSDIVSAVLSTQISPDYTAGCAKK